MAVHKKEEFDSADQKISLIAKAMAHPARIAILRILAAGSRTTCGKIVEILPLAQATVSHHLKELHEANVIDLVSEGKKSFYEINWETWNAYTKEFSLMLSLLNKKNNIL